MSAIQIYYNNSNPFSGISPTPLISRSFEMVDFGGRWCAVENISLSSALTGRCPDYTGILYNQQLLLSGFRQDFGSLIIKSGASNYISHDLVEITSITFEDSTYASAYLPFTINLRLYPSGFFSGDYGVINPKNEWSFGESNDGIVTINHNISCQGLPTSSGMTNNSLTNAKSWVAARTGYINSLTPLFISGFNSGNACLRELREVYDRLNGTYSISETYQADIYDSGVGLLRYAVDIRSGIEDGITTVTVDGNIQGCRAGSLTDLRSRYSSFNSFNTANGALYRLYGRNDLNSIPISKTVSEDQKGKLIDFSFTYNDDARPRVNIVYDIGFNYDYVSDSVNAEITATVSAKGAYTSSKWADVLSVANAINLYSIIAPAYNTYVSEVAPHLSAYPLNPAASASSRSEDEYNTIIILKASYNNTQQPPNGFKKLDSTISISPALHQYSLLPILDGLGDYYGFDLNYISRGTCEINLSAIGDISVTAAFIEEFLKTEALRLQNLYFVGTRRKVLESQEIKKSNESFDRKRDLSATWTSEQTEFQLGS